MPEKAELPHSLDELGVRVGKEAGKALPAAGEDGHARPPLALQALCQPPRRRWAPDLGQVAVDDDQLDGRAAAALRAAVLLHERVQGGVGERLTREVDSPPQVATAEVVVSHVQNDNCGPGAAGGRSPGRQAGGQRRRALVEGLASYVGIPTFPAYPSAPPAQ